MTWLDALWVYRARIARAVDGDTIDVVIDAGFRSTRTERLRLSGVNCPEVHGATKAAGDAATAFTQAWLRVGIGLDAWPLIVRTEKSDVFGRYLARVWRVSDGAELNADLLASGHAVPFMVEGKD
jgi:micrococcal nuclease